MNCSTFIFSKSSSGYVQYPEDNSSSIFNKILKGCKAQTQIVAHRDDRLMYYTYVRKLDSNQCIGLVYVVNGYFVNSVNKMFTLFERTIEQMASRGVFLKYSNGGELILSNVNYKSNEPELQAFSADLTESFERLNKFTALPIVNYGVAIDSEKDYLDSDPQSDIVKATYTYGYTYIYKDKDFNTVQINSYRSILANLNNENDNLRSINSTLHKENQEILRKKKQFTNVVLLSLAVVACCAGLYFLNDSLNSTERMLSVAENEIGSLTDSVSLKTQRIENLSEINSNLSTKVEDLESTSKRQTDSIRRFIRENEELVERNDYLDRSLTTEKNRVSSLQRDLRSKDNSLSSLRKDYNSLKDTYSSYLNNSPFVVTSWGSIDRRSLTFTALSAKTYTCNNIKIEAVDLNNGKTYKLREGDLSFTAGSKKNVTISYDNPLSDSDLRKHYFYFTISVNGKIIAGIKK